jgi:pyruvate,water dikinase
MELILNFDSADKASLPQVGGKNASLGEMIKAGIRVPPGFAVTTASYQSFIAETGIENAIFALLSDLDVDDVDALNRVSAGIQELMNTAAMPERVHQGILDGYAELCRMCGTEKVPVAVRSSATAEDLPTASFAGQQDTYLWVLGAEQVVDSAKRCWASLFTPRAISYRVKNDFPHEKVLISVGVQKMVHAKAAGVMFTLNPTNGDPSKVVIEGSWGLGETVVSGSVTPDKFVVDKVIMEVSEKTVSRKHIECVYNAEKGGVVDADVVPDRQTSCCLDDREVMDLVQLAKRIEEHYGRPMDIEWAIDEDIPFPENVFIVQARPETVWSRKRKESVIGKKSGYQLLMEQAMKRIKIS